MLLRALLALAVVLVGLALHSRNAQIVTLDFYVRSFAIPLSWALVAALALGALCGVVAMLPRFFARKREEWRERKQAARGPGSDPARPLSDHGNT